MKIIYEKDGKLHDMSTRAGREEILGKSGGKTILVHDEQGELISFYKNPADLERNAQLVKSIKSKYPGQPLLKAVSLYEDELFLKARGGGGGGGGGELIS
ncbi:MAG: hypothetical protein WC856_26495 [Methylococcaceae bacterium]|jgi:hypothetical protein